VPDLLRGAPPARRERDIWVLSSSTYRRPNGQGGYECAFAEHLREQLGERLLFVERNHAALPRLHRDDLVFVDAALVAAEALGRTAGPVLAQTPLGSEARKPGSPASASLLCREAIYGRVLLEVARNWIRRATPRAVFVLNAYHLFIPFQLAAREAGIPVIELQHGIIHESHPGYIFDGTPALGHLPDHLVVFGRHFGELLDRESPRWRGRWSVGGHPWLKLKRRGVDNLPESSFDSVVIFSQPHAPVRERIRPLLPELRAKLDPKIRLVLKPHPREFDAADYYGEALRGIELASVHDDSYELLRKCRLAVSMYSTVSFEALAFRCRSAVLRGSMWMDDFRALVDAGVLPVVDTAHDIARLAALPMPPRAPDDLTNRLFAVDEPAPDFERLIGSVTPSLRYKSSS